MWSHGLIIAPDIINNGLFSLSNILITVLWHPFYFKFKASEKPSFWCIIPKISTTAHTLFYTFTTRHGFSKLLASVIDSLIRMQQHAPGFDPSVVRHLQRFSGQHASGESDSVNPTTRRAYRPKKTAR